MPRLAAGAGERYRYRAQPITDLAIELDDRPGALAEMGETLGRAGVNIDVPSTIVVGGIPITITRKRIKHVHLRVNAPDGRVTISAPPRVRLSEIETFVASRLSWITRHQERVRHYKPAKPPPREAQVRHKALLNEALPPLIKTWEARLNVRLTGYHLRYMRTRWGTCNCRAKRIRLNTELATKPAHLLEYVLVHELVHLIVPNHGKRFVALMNEHYPSWREARAELNESCRQELETLKPVGSQ